MNLSFLLRFQEDCDESSDIAASNGTATYTKIMTEQPDGDQSTRNFRPISSQRFLSVLGTMTKTGRPMESDDNDPKQKELRAIPKCY